MHNDINALKIALEESRARFCERKTEKIASLAPILIDTRNFGIAYTPNSNNTLIVVERSCRSTLTLDFTSYFAVGRVWSLSYT